MQTTANYALKKPENSDTVKIEDLNDNSDTIDAELKKRALQTDLTKTQKDFDTHKADNTAHGIGDKTKLSTTAKDTIVNAINEVFQSGTNVKSSTISAVNSKGGNLSTSATWNQIIAAINSIARGQGNAVESQVLSGADFSNSDGILRHGGMPNNGGVDIIPSGSVQTIAKGYHNGSGKVEAVVVPVSNVLTGTNIAGQAGTMTNNGAISGTITNQGQSVSIPEGYTKGGSIVANFANLIASNIKKDVNIGSIIGTLDIESLGGKKWASGSGNVQSTLSVTGLTFTPSYIIFSFSNSDRRNDLWVYTKNWQPSNIFLLDRIKNYPITINSDGFTINTLMALRDDNNVAYSNFTYTAIE